MIRKLYGLLFVIGIALPTALAQQPQQTTSADRIRQAVTYLASDALEGRRTGTPGANDAAHYIAGEFNRFGLRPGLQMARPARTRGETQARYLQPFPYVSEATLGQHNLFFINPGRADDMAQVMVGKDWIPLGFSSNGSIKNAEAIFAGYGIVASGLKYNDYEVSNAKDRIAVVFAGSPDGDNPHGQFGQSGEVRFKAAAARAAGAVGLLIIANEENLKDDRMARLSYDNAGEAGIPIMVISRQLAGRILRSSDPKLADFEKAADARTAAGSNLRLALPGERLTVEVNVVRRESPSFNVIGILPGSDPKLKNEVIVLGAHYDHLGRGGQGSLATREGDIHHGADDNASGVSGLIELARMLSSSRPRRTILFIAFSGEEEGLLGSTYYVEHPVMPLASTVAMINMDMIGRLKDRKLIVGGVGTASEWRSIIQSNNSPEKVTLVNVAKMPMPMKTTVETFDLTLNEDGFGPSDHSSFYGKQIPVLFLWTGTHDDYHKPSDTAEKINYEAEARIVSFVGGLVRDVDMSDKRPTYTVAKSEAQGRGTGFRVYLGTIPNYADSNDGLKLDGIRDDSPAAKAGLKAGDKIVKMAGHEVKNVYDYTFALGEMKGGQEYEVEVMRGSERLTLKITPVTRK